MTRAERTCLPAQKATLLRALRHAAPQCRGVDVSMPEGLRRTVVDVPYSVVSGPLRDLTVVYIAKVAQLARNRERECVAKLTTMATYLGLTNRTAVDSRSGKTVTKAPSSLFAAQKEATEAGLVTVRRRTQHGGRGTSAVRTLGPFAADDFRVPVPVALLGAVSARHARVYMLISYAHRRRIPFTEADLASYIRHESGRRKGEPISTYSASQLVDDLERWGWLEVLRRAGHQGRNILIPRRTPLESADTPVDNLKEEVGERSEIETSADLGSEASADLPRVSEDRFPEVRESTVLQLTAPSPVGEVGSDGPVENRAAASSGDLALRAERAQRSPATQVRMPYTGPELTVTPAIAYALEPVRSLILRGAVSVVVQRRVAREIGRQLSFAIAPQRIRQRLQDRFLGAGFEIRNPNGWLIRAVERWGCEKAECEEGVIWETGERCERCHFRREESRRAGLAAWRKAHPQEALAGDLLWDAKRAQMAREKASRARAADSVANRLAIREAQYGDAECIGKDGLCGRTLHQDGETLCPECAGYSHCPVLNCWTWYPGDACPDPHGLSWEHMTFQQQEDAYARFGHHAGPYAEATESELLIGLT